ncbi:IS3 family transposase [Streptomyces sp. NPDC052023]|uniref:IS3 family transposase n=1 Tax=Streptomyces sp. NPDC052023 TaxID=3365681 RepID=UPI0037D0AC49
MNDVYAFIEAEKTTHGVALLCRLLKIARSSFYSWLAGEQARAARRAADDALAHEITVLHIASRHTYGVPRIHAELRRLDRRVNRKRVERIMRERGITGVTRRKRQSLTRPAKRAVPAADLIGRDFTADAPGRKLVGDITFIATDEGWLYLATWLDLATREIVGYSMADHHRASLVVNALTMAAGRDRLDSGCIVPSDRGSEYTSDELRREISRLGLRQSMGRTGSCYDNAAAESFFALLNQDLLQRSQVRLSVTAEPSATVRVEVGRTDHDQPQSVRGNLRITPGVVQRPLLAPMDAADGEPVGLVEVGYGLVVLEFPVLDHELVAGPVGVDRQFGPSAARPGVALQPVELVLGQGRLAEQLVAQADYVCLVTVVSGSHARASCQRSQTSRRVFRCGCHAGTDGFQRSSSSTGSGSRM